MNKPGLLEQWWLSFATWLADWPGMPYVVLFGALAACGLAVFFARWSASAADSEGNSLFGQGVALAFVALVLLAALLQTPAVNAILRDGLGKLARDGSLVEAYRSAVRASLGT